MGMSETRQFKYHLYVISEDTDKTIGIYSGFIKVGISQNPLIRMKDLQCANPRQLKFLLILGMRNKVESEIYEKGIHSKMSFHLEKNEWFKYNKYTDGIVEELRSLKSINVTESFL